MQWRVLVRRNPLRSFTVVGDVAQAAAAAASTSWGEALHPHVGDNWRLEELTVNYRTPARVSDVAEAMALAHGVRITRSRSVRPGDWPVALIATSDRVAATIAAVSEERSRAGSGTIAVIAAESVVADLYPGLVEAFGREAGRGAAGLTRRIAILTPQESKGLEFDSVVVVEPQRIIDELARGAGALYVAMTRATQRLQLVSSDPWPSGVESH